MRNTFAMAATFLLLALSPRAANSTIVPGLDLDQLVRDSNVIVVGEVISLQGGRKHPSTWTTQTSPVRPQSAYFT